MKQESLKKLHDAIATMDIPEARKTSGDPADLRWLGRNMVFRNKDHPHFKDAVAALKELNISFILE